jgi:hypothetical protein
MDFSKCWPNSDEREGIEQAIRVFGRIRPTLGTTNCSVSVLSVTADSVVNDQKHDGAHSCHYNAVQIQPRHTDVVEQMEDPTADVRAYHA